MHALLSCMLLWLNKPVSRNLNMWGFAHFFLVADLSLLSGAYDVWNQCLWVSKCLILTFTLLCML